MAVLSTLSALPLDQGRTSGRGTYTLSSYLRLTNYIVHSPQVGHEYAAEYISKLTPEMQQWWTMHVSQASSIISLACSHGALKLRPKYAELTQLGVGGAEARKESWYIRCLAVDPAKQRQGIGRCLLDTIARMVGMIQQKEK